MKTRQWTGIAAAAFVAWQLAAPVPSHAQDTLAAPLSEEYVKQDEIYHRQRVSRGYVVDRSLEGYCYMLPDAFERALADLDGRDRWLDVGAGQGQAILDYHAPAQRATARRKRGRKAQSVAVSIEDRRTPEWDASARSLEAGTVQYRHGKRLREYAPEELGRFDVITDVMGGFAYADDLTVYMRNVMQLLEVDGSFFSVLQDVEFEAQNNKPWYDGYPFATEIENPGGPKVTICSWLKSIACAEVRCEARPDRRPQQEVYQVHKVCNQVSVPALVPVDYQAGTPPQRGFRLESRRQTSDASRQRE
jgi:SAM-dependent methyltransferase